MHCKRMKKKKKKKKKKRNATKTVNDMNVEKQKINV